MTTRPCTLSLAGSAWTVRAVDGGGGRSIPIGQREIAAVVPGCVHLDLVRAGLVRHPDDGSAETDLAWIGWTNWSYRRGFDVPAVGRAHTRLDLVAEGVDTVATLAVNGQEIGRTANMHHPHRFDLRGLATAEANDLVVLFEGPRRAAARLEDEYGPRPVNADGAWGPYAYVRKAACGFGWDWGPCVPTVGMWRTVGLHAWSIARLAGVRPLVRRADEAAAIVDVAVACERADARGDELLQVTAQLDGPRGLRVTTTVDVDRAEAVARIEIPKPARWWPRGYGGQPLYTLTVTLTGPGAARLDMWRGRIGLRTVRLEVEPDDLGAPFTIVVNDRPLFARGANWIPCSTFPGQAPDATVRRRVEQAHAANMNMLRVWGGGLYERDAFYDACDALGIMVWQDFAFACAAYPEEDPYPALIATEARHAVTRLCRHPSLVLWCGGNENILAYECWGWKERMPAGQSWGRAYFHERLPEIVSELDPTRPYWPDSPYGGRERVDPNDPDRGDRHTWDLALDEQRAIVPRFVSEFGHQAPPEWATLRRALGAEPVAVGSPADLHRQRATGGHARWYEPHLETWFGEDAAGDRWHLLTRILQARALRIGLEWLRAHRGRCMGALIWQLNDVWAGHSWSIVDVDGRRKPAWYAVRRSLAPRLLTIQPLGDDLLLHAVNDTPEPWVASALLQRVGFDGRVMAAAPVAITVPPDAALVVANATRKLGPPVDTADEVITAEAGEQRTWWFFARDHALRYPAPRYRVETTRVAPDAVRLVVTAETLLRDLVVAPDRLDPRATIDDNLVTLLPGERWAATIGTRREVGAKDLAWPVMGTCAPM